jgi:hypothetical protein
MPGRKWFAACVCVVLFVLGAGFALAQEVQYSITDVGGVWTKMRQLSGAASTVEFGADYMHVEYRGTRYTYSINGLDADTELGITRLTLRLSRNNSPYTVTVLILDEGTMYLGGRVAAGTIWGTYSRAG